MTRSILYTLIMTSILLCGCEHTEMANDPSSSILTVEVLAEAFTSTEKNSTRASEELYKTKFANGDQIGVTAIKDGKIVDGVNNVCFTYKASTMKWEASTESASLYYYPDVTYLAYYPYDAAMNDKTSEEAIINAFTPQTDQSTYVNYTKSDLMTGTGVVSAINGKSVLTFQLTHGMSLLVIYPRGQHYQTSDGYDFYAPPKAITTLKVGNMTTVYQPGDCSYRAIVAPGTVDVTINYTTTEDAIFEYTGSVTTTTGKYNEMLLAPASPALIYTITAGDYFFADGGLLPATAPLDKMNKKNCLGIVYHVGAGEGDSTNDYNGKLAAIHGYVLSVYCKDGDVTYGPYEDAGTSKSSSDYKGYYNTMKMIAAAESHGGLSGVATEAGGYPVAYYATIVCQSLYPAPVNTSGWYLPSAGQLREAYNNKSVIEANFDKIVSGNTLFPWIRTSSESSDIRFAYVLDNGNLNSSYGKDASWYKAYSSLTF